MAMLATQASPMGRMTAPQLKPPSACGGRVTTGILKGQVAPYAEGSARALTRIVSASDVLTMIEGAVRALGEAITVSAPLDLEDRRCLSVLQAMELLEDDDDDATVLSPSLLRLVRRYRQRIAVGDRRHAVQG